MSAGPGPGALPGRAGRGLRDTRLAQVIDNARALLMTDLLVPAAEVVPERRVDDYDDDEPSNGIEGQLANEICGNEDGGNSADVITAGLDTAGTGFDVTLGNDGGTPVSIFRGAASGVSGLMGALRGWDGAGRDRVSGGRGCGGPGREKL